LTVHFLDVGQGDAILVEGPDSARVLIDGGRSGRVLQAALDRRLPFYDRSIDVVINTHPQADHLGGLPDAVRRYDVKAALVPPGSAETAAYREWMRALAGAGVARLTARAGQTIDLGGGAVLQVIAAGGPDSHGREPNDASLVLRLTMGDVSMLLTGDAGERAEQGLAELGVALDAEVLKVAHHGSRDATSPGFVARVRPLISVISVGAGNRFGHPAPETLAHLSSTRVYRTDVHGDVTVSTDGDRLWVRTQR
jgi:competence protein ComEC